MDRCDQEVFDKGQSLAAIDGRSKDVNPWVEKVAQESGQRVDWHYSGGVAHVLVLGDHAKALETAKRLAPELVGRVMRWFGADDAGCYRAGVTPLPAEVVAVDVIGAVTTGGRKDIERLAQEVSNAAYKAVVKPYEEAERAGLIVGNGHHMAQKIAADAKALLLERHAKAQAQSF